MVSQKLFYQTTHLASRVAANGNVLGFMWGPAGVLSQFVGSWANAAVDTVQTDRAGSVVGAEKKGKRSVVSYSPYGNRSLGSVSSIGLNGEPLDEVLNGYGLGNGFRYFIPALMRFCSADALSPFGSGGVSAYAYCGGDPVNRSDPTGRVFGSLGKAAGLKHKTGLTSGLTTAGFPPRQFKPLVRAHFSLPYAPELDLQFGSSAATVTKTGKVYSVTRAQTRQELEARNAALSSRLNKAMADHSVMAAERSNMANSIHSLTRRYEHTLDRANAAEAQLAQLQFDNPELEVPRSNLAAPDGNLIVEFQITGNAAHANINPGPLAARERDEIRRSQR